MPLRARLALLALCGAIIVSSVGGAVFVRQLRTSLHASVDTSLRTRANAVVQSVGESGSDLNFQDSGSTPLVNGDESLAQVIAPGGRVEQSSQAAGDAALIPVSKL